jgi:hypothetical protein
MIPRIIERVSREIDLVLSRSTRLDSLQTVCLALGPYRNLTTLTASILFLHPNCQVLNHGGERILDDDRMSFLQQYSDQRFETFARFAIHISKGGRRGTYGGSITRSHAFDKRYKTKEVFEGAGLDLVKHDIVSLFWKESMVLSNHIHQNSIDLGSLFARNPKLRFLLPIRNPLDATISNIKTGHTRYFVNVSDRKNPSAILEALLDEYVWIKEQHALYPDRFFYFFEYELNEQTLVRLAAFLELDPSPAWLANAVKALEINKGYEHDPALVAQYERWVGEKFAAFPDFAGKLLRFTA